MKRYLLIFLLILSFSTAGCIQSILKTIPCRSVTQEANMVDAINGKLHPINFNKTYIRLTFGVPDFKTVDTKNDVTTEVWTYKTVSDKTSPAFLMKAHKPRYMKITMRNNIVTDVSFEQ